MKPTSSFYLTKNTLCLHYKTQSFQILYSEILDVYRVNHMKNVNTKCKQNKTKQNAFTVKKNTQHRKLPLSFKVINKAGGGGMKTLSADPTETLNGTQPR